MNDGEIERLLRFLYLCPVGLADHGAKGEVRMMNALAVQMLMPLSPDGQMENVFSVLKGVAPDLPTLVERYAAPSGMIVQDRAITVRNQREPRHYSLSILRIESDTYMAALSDVTQTVVNEEIARAALRSQAAQEGRVEILTGILHDIGNGITGMGTRTAILEAAPPWDELDQLSKLGAFFRKHQTALEAALSTDKAAALLSFVDTVIGRFQHRATEWRDTVALFSKSILHVQEIINIQRQFVHGGSTTRRMLNPEELLEAFDANGSEPARRTLRIVIRRLPPHHLEFSFTDNACGFEAPQGTLAVTRGHTTKQSGSGLGLSSCIQSVTSHQGTFTLQSPGRGLGATCCIVLPMKMPTEAEAFL